MSAPRDDVNACTPRQCALSMTRRPDPHRIDGVGGWDPWIHWASMRRLANPLCDRDRLWSLGEQGPAISAVCLPNMLGPSHLSFMLGLAASALELSALRSTMSFSIEARSLSNSAGSGTATVAAAGLS